MKKSILIFIVIVIGLMFFNINNEKKENILIEAEKIVDENETMNDENDDFIDINKSKTIVSNEYNITEYYDDNVTIFKITFYKDGVKNGLEKEYRENGVLLWERPYKDDKLNGTARKYFLDGDSSQEINFINGLKEGMEYVYKKYDIPNIGIIRYMVKETNYFNDLKNDIQYTYKVTDEGEKLFSEVNYDDGWHSTREYYSNGQLYLEAFRVEGGNVTKIYSKDDGLEMIITVDYTLNKRTVKNRRIQNYKAYELYWSGKKGDIQMYLEKGYLVNDENEKITMTQKQINKYEKHYYDYLEVGNGSTYLKALKDE